MQHTKRAVNTGQDVQQVTSCSCNAKMLPHQCDAGSRQVRANIVHLPGRCAQGDTVCGSCKALQVCQSAASLPTTLALVHVQLHAGRATHAHPHVITLANFNPVSARDTNWFRIRQVCRFHQPIHVKDQLRRRNDMPASMHASYRGAQQCLCLSTVQFRRAVLELA